LLIFCGRKRFQLGGAARNSLVVELSEKGNAPPAAGASAAAKGELARHPRPLASNEINELSPRDVKTVTHLIIKVHRRLQARW
jgi:hypothetical protein